jgi:hypothetical protein
MVNGACQAAAAQAALLLFCYGKLQLHFLNDLLVGHAAGIAALQVRDRAAAGGCRASAAQAAQHSSSGGRHMLRSTAGESWIDVMCCFELLHVRCVVVINGRYTAN